MYWKYQIQLPGWTIELVVSTTEGNFLLSLLFSHLRWCNIKALPGANRLIKHLKGHGIPMALASNSPRDSIEAKISYHDGWFISGSLSFLCSFWLYSLLICELVCSFVFFMCRMEKLFLCHNWWRWSQNRKTFSWNVRCYNVVLSLDYYGLLSI